MEYIAIFLLMLLILSLFVNYNLYNKISAYDESIDEAEKYVEQITTYTKDLKRHTQNAYDRMQQLDNKGIFEADDEVGYVFNELKVLIEELNDKTI